MYCVLTERSIVDDIGMEVGQNYQCSVVCILVIRVFDDNLKTFVRPTH